MFDIPMSVSRSAIALPRIAEDLGSDPAALQWVVNGFVVAVALSGLVRGVASDRLGYRNTFQSRIITFHSRIIIALVAAVVSVVAPTLLILDAARVVASAGSAAFYAERAS